MLKLIFFCFFMTPLISSYWIMSNMISMLTMMFIIIFNKNFIMISYSMQIDNISFGLMILSMWISFLMISSNNYSEMKMFIFFNFITYNNFNFVIFFIKFNYILYFFEFSLIPTVIIIMGWGYQPERLIASYYLLFYTLFASLPMLLSIMFLFFLMKMQLYMW